MVTIIHASHSALLILVDKKVDQTIVHVEIFEKKKWCISIICFYGTVVHIIPTDALGLILSILDLILSNWIKAEALIAKNFKCLIFCAEQGGFSPLLDAKFQACSCNVAGFKAI